MIQVKPRLYGDVNQHRHQSYYNMKIIKFNIRSIEHYEIITKIDTGKFSDIYIGINVLNGQYVVIKVLKSINIIKIKREIKVLNTVKDHPNIIELKEVVKDPVSRSSCLIFDFFKDISFQSIIPKMTNMDNRYYLFQLFKALDYCHSKGVMHRDIKPTNIIINLQKKILKLIDWGLAEFYHVGQGYNVSVATMHFKDPELLVDYNYYDYSLDVWSTGAMFAGMIIFKIQIFFMGTNCQDQLVKICQVLGTEGLFKYLKKHLQRMVGKHMQNACQACQTVVGVHQT